MSLISRRTALGVLGSVMMFQSLSKIAKAASGEINLLDPSKLREQIAKLSAATSTKVSLTGNCVGDVTYYSDGLSTGPTVLYFHGTGGEFRSAALPEYCLYDNFNVIFMNRPGYGGTASEWTIDGKRYDSRSNPAGALETAKIAAALLDVIQGIDRSHVYVIGTSGGAPSALAFASQYPERTKALILQAGFTHPWRDQASVCYLPPGLLDVFLKAIDDPQASYEHQTTKLVVGFASLGLKSHDYWLRTLIGDRLDEVRCDPAFEIVTNIEVPSPRNPFLQPSESDTAGLYSDLVAIFRSRTELCDWNGIKAPTLIIHDAEDPFMHYVHAQYAAKLIANATLKTYRLGGHMIWLGRDAADMHAARVEFLNAHG